MAAPRASGAEAAAARSPAGLLVCGAGVPSPTPGRATCWSVNPAPAPAVCVPRSPVDLRGLGSELGERSLGLWPAELLAGELPCRGAAVPETLVSEKSCAGGSTRIAPK